MAIRPTTGRWRRAAVWWVASCLLATAACSGGGNDPAGSASSSSAPASTAPSSAAAGTYLALGDSVPFGYRGGQPAETYGNPADFVGYPELAGSQLGMHVVNASCPGETTASFADATAQSNGCENRPGAAGGYRTAYPLHVDYDAPDQSQLDFAVRTLKDTADVGLVTLQVGANDAFICQATTADQCMAEVVQVATTVQTNVTTILSTLRDQGGYTGRIVVVSYYALDYADANGAAGTQLLDTAIAGAAKANDATVASGYDAFQPLAQQQGGSSIAAGLVRPNDVHPTAQGQQLLADAVVAATHAG
jgi:lysophospholipase L1-like esterase